jgi:hypothetical protein
MAIKKLKKFKKRFLFSPKFRLIFNFATTFYPFRVRVVLFRCKVSNTRMFGEGGGLFDSAFRKREEAARKWREQNDFRFDASASSQRSFNPIVIPREQAQSPTKSPDTLSPSMFNHLLSRTVSEEEPAQVLQNNNNYNRVPTPVMNSAQLLPSAENPVPNNSDVVEPSNEIKTTEEERVSSPASETAEDNTGDLLTYLKELSLFGKLSMIGFLLILVYLHFAFQSVGDFLSLFQPEKFRSFFSRFVPPTIATENGDSENVLFVFSQVVLTSFQQWCSQFDWLDWMVILSGAALVTILFDSSTAVTDQFVSSQWQASKEWSVQQYNKIKDSVYETTHFLHSVYVQIQDTYQWYQRKTPKFVQLMICLSLLSFLVRYVLLTLWDWSSVYLVEKFFKPFRWFFLFSGVLLSGFVALQYYLMRRKQRQEIIHQLTILTKYFLSVKKQFSSPVDYLFFEVEDYFMKRDLQQRMKENQKKTNHLNNKSHKNKNWASWMHFFRNSTDENTAEENIEALEGNERGRSLSIEEEIGFPSPLQDFLPSSTTVIPQMNSQDLRSYSLKSLWPDVVKEVNKDKRIRTILMFIDGAQRKCWKIVSGSNTNASGTKPQE